MATDDRRSWRPKLTMGVPEEDHLRATIVKLTEPSMIRDPGGTVRPPTVEVKIAAGAAVWIAEQIVQSGTAKCIVDDPDYIAYYVTPPHGITAETYMRWIQSWIETHWTETLAEYLTLSLDAMRKA